MVFFKIFSLDNDEAIVPVQHLTWNEMLKDIINDDPDVVRGAWMFFNYYFLTELGDDNKTEPGNPILNRKSRLPMRQGIVKYFTNTSEATILDHHTPRIGC